MKIIKIIKHKASNLIRNITIFNIKIILNNIKIKSNLNSNYEIFSMVSHKYFWTYLVSIISFNYSTNINGKISIIDDGTLTNNDIKILKNKIKNINIIRYNKNIEEILKKYPYIKKQRSKLNVMKKLIDCLFFSTKNKIILLDSDIIFTKIANENFINLLKNSRIISAKDLKPLPYFRLNGELLNSNYFKKIYKKEFNKNIEFVKYFNTGIVKFNKKDIDFEIIENFIKFIHKKTIGIVPKLDNWLYEQTSFAYNYSFKKIPTQLLPFKEFTVYKPGSEKIIKNAIAVHFVNQWRFINFSYIKYLYKFYFNYKKSIK